MTRRFARAACSLILLPPLLAMCGSNADDAEPRQPANPLLRPARFTETAPATFRARFDTSDGEFVLDQVFQMVSGTMRRDEREFAISSGRLTGYDVVFRAGSSTYRGEVNVNADTILGTVTTGGRTVEWVAMR